MKFDTRFRLLAVASMAAVSLPTLAMAQTVTVTDLVFEGESGFKVSIPTIEVTGSSIDEAAIRGLFTGGLESAAKTLSSLDADSIRIPELIITATMTPATGTSVSSTTTYRDFELDGVTDGVATSARLGGADVSSSSPNVAEQVSMTMGAMSTGLLDIGAIVGFYGYGEPSDEMKPIYADLVFDGFTMTTPVFSCTIGQASAAEFSARPLTTSLDEVMKWSNELMAAGSGEAVPSPEAVKGIATYYIDILTAFASSPTVVDGFDCSGKTEKGEDVAVTSGALNIGGFVPGIYPAISLAGLRVDVPGEGWLELGSFTWKTMDLNGPIEVVRQNLDNLNPAWFEANWRALIPALAGFSFENFAIDVPNENQPGERVQATVGDFDISLADYVNGIPSDIAASSSGIVIPVPPTGEGTAMLHALGVDTLNLGYDIALKWDEATGTIAVNSLTLSGENLATIGISGTIANAGPALFSSDLEAAMAAAMGLTVTNLTIDVENAGLAPLLIAAAAADQGQPPEAFQVVAAGMARAMPLAMLGGTAEALALSNALGAFLEGQPNISITLTSIDPKGVGLAELMAAQADRLALKGKVTITAESSGEAVPFVYPELPSGGMIAIPQSPTPDETPAPAPAPAEETNPRADEKAGSKQ